MITSADRAMLARVLTHDLKRAPQIKRAPLALGAVSAVGEFEGYASLFGIADLGRDVVDRGAFAASLRKRCASQIKMLWQHDPAEPLGAWLSVAEDGVGLKVRGRLNLAVSRAREILALMREGQVDGLSIGFRTEREKTDRKTGLRHLQKIDLWEISLVTFPMLPQARVTAVKRRAADPMASVAFQLDNAAARAAQSRWRRAATNMEVGLSNATKALERRFDPNQARDELGRWTNESGGGSSPLATAANVVAQAVSATAGVAGDDAGFTASAALDACDAQYELDSSLCRMLGSRMSRAKCWASASERLAACLAGRPILPLSF